MAETESTKSCRGCGQDKRLGAFHSDRSRPDGLRNQCKACVNRYHRELRAKKPGHYIDYSRRYYRKHSTEIIRYEQARRASMQVRYAANNAVNNAIRDGKLERQPCEVCGKPNAHGHHEDYSKPLDVNWLCRRHHADRHRALRQQGLDL